MTVWWAMKRRLLASLIFVALALPVHVHHAQEALSAQSGSTMWGCAPMGERRNVLYLIDRGARSYVRFSDQRIAEMLRVANIEIARRTVTKYRESLNILSSTKRREVG